MEQHLTQAASLQHYGVLQEVHQVQVQVPRPLPHASIELARWRNNAWRMCTEVAQTWAMEEGVAVDPEPYEMQDDENLPSFWGVRFTITVGLGNEPVWPGEAAQWSWSDRWRTWWETFRTKDRPHLSVLPGGVVTPMRARRR